MGNYWKLGAGGCYSRGGNGSGGACLSRKAKRKLLEPGYWGSLEDEELEIIQKALENNPNLSFAWGFQPLQKSRAPDAIRRVAMWGDPKDREFNTKVIRRSRMRVS